MKTIVAVLHNIRSVHNVGSIFRTADAVGVSKIYLTGITPTPLDRLGKFRMDFTKVSLGAEKTVPWEYAARTASTIKKLREDGYLVCAIEQSPRSVPYNRLKTKQKKIALVFGNEVRGLPPSVLSACDKVLEIPMHGMKESLNVSVAFGIAVYGMCSGV
ncbi:MAG: RNA methyltransferase [Candidatus Jorgensenbacteria bacterium]|nr:RNA methyltransferase [Candidatus Jorgensenbacteria bacterium]